ncbi:hypothetical protein [Paenibacillus foliorum]|uniref:hypothetical protein n=1 Tax=Paenibacillus foliorum TaxID=2654974 RepID=UPI001491ECD8|nr:hypothetical protein [Paenibacillus foliorum]
MEIIKNTKSEQRFNGLGLVTIIAGLVIFLPFVYFMISWALGEVPPVAGGVVR